MGWQLTDVKAIVGIVGLKPTILHNTVIFGGGGAETFGAHRISDVFCELVELRERYTEVGSCFIIYLRQAELPR
jgi:hypothetical protein